MVKRAARRDIAIKSKVNWSEMTVDLRGLN